MEDIFIEDLKDRGVQVTRSSPFIEYTSTEDAEAPIQITCGDGSNESRKSMKAKYLVGCDGARSMVRNSIPHAEMEGDSTRAPWGVLDGRLRSRLLLYVGKTNGDPGVIETNFPDLWSKVVIHSEEHGTILCIPRERNMTRLYIELNPGMKELLSSEAASQEFVMKRAQEIVAPFTLTWKSVGKLSILII